MPIQNRIPMRPYGHPGQSHHPMRTTWEQTSDYSSNIFQTRINSNKEEGNTCSFDRTQTIGKYSV